MEPDTGGKGLMNVWAKAAVQGAACGLMIGVVLLVGGRVWRPATVAAQAPVVPAVMKAQRFELVDAAGKLRALLWLPLSGAPGLDLLDGTGAMRASLSLSPDGSPKLDLSDATGKRRAVLGAANLEAAKTGEETKRSESSLVLFDKDGKVIWQAP